MDSLTGKRPQATHSHHRITPMTKGAAILVAIVAFLIGCAAGCSFGEFRASRPHDSAASNRATQPFSAQQSPAAQIGPCRDANPGTIDIINDGFITPGEHLTDVQVVNSGPRTYLGGNIADADGGKLSSQDTWVLTSGRVYAITSDARSRTTFPDGRHIPGVVGDWPDGNAAVGQCVGTAERARNSGG